MRRWRWVVGLVLLGSACGGGASDGGDDGLTTVTSDDELTTVASGDGLTTVTIDDVVVTLEVPDGAVPAGTQIEIKAGSVPPELAEMNDVTTYAFELEPSGLEFSEPATLTFRLAAPGDTGTPPALVIIEGSEGTATLLSTETVREGDEVQVSALVDHFSQAYMIVFGVETILTPELLQMPVGESDRSEVKERRPGQTTFFPYFNYDGEERATANALPIASEFISVRRFSFGAEVTCIKETKGVIENAYEVVVTTLYEEVEQLPPLFPVPGGIDSKHRFRLLGDVRCTEAVSASGTTTTAQLPAPESLQAVVPTSVVSVVNDRTVEIEIEFPEGARAVAEGLHLFEVSAHVFGEDLRVSGLVRSTDGEILVDGRSVQDVIKDAQLVWEWRDDNHFLMTITTEDVAVPGTAPEVSVVVQETPDTEVFTFNA